MGTLSLGTFSRERWPVELVNKSRKGPGAEYESMAVSEGEDE